MTLKLSKGKGLFFGLLLGAIFFGITIWGINYSIASSEIVFKMVLLLPTYLFLAAFLFMYFGLLTTKYIVDEQALTIVWAHKRYIIPWGEITEASHAEGKLNFLNILGCSWPGYVAGTYLVKGLTVGKVFGTAPENILMLKSSIGNFGINASPELLKAYKEHCQVELKEIDYFELPDEVVGKNPSEDLLYLALYALNVISVFALAAFLGIFLPGNAAGHQMVVLLMVLAMFILAFFMTVANRLFGYMESASYGMWGLGLLINVTFLIMAIVTLT
ncbi:MAG: PH domain-containing protein [Candidatus Saccharibacteria bacterium]